MTLKITDECINCDVCEPLCPNNAIFEGKLHYEIKKEKCTECKGFHDEPQCAAVCPVDCCVPDEDWVEEENFLLKKKDSLHNS